jgi:hypothetical protein
MNNDLPSRGICFFNVVLLYSFSISLIYPRVNVVLLFWFFNVREYTLLFGDADEIKFSE